MSKNIFPDTQTFYQRWCDEQAEEVDGAEDGVHLGKLGSI
jgi:hypothetical protein